MTSPYDPQQNPMPSPAYGTPQAGQPGPPPENNLVWAILCTVLCCLPLGIVSIIKSTQVNSLWFQGFHDEARKSAEDAKKWAMWGAIISVALYVIGGIIYVIFLGFLFSHMPDPSHMPTMTDMPTDIPTT